jgi:HAD superfamily hydrolase (TIGR01509 family)
VTAMTRISEIKAIAFDADGTLWDFDKVMRHSLGCVLGELERYVPRASARVDIDRMIEIRNRVAEESESGIVDFEAIRLESFRRILIEIGSPDDTLASHLYEIYMKHRYEDIELYGDVLPVIGELKGKYTLGLLSNGNSYPERCGLGGVFEFTVFSWDHKVKKPDPQFFRIAVEKAGCRREQLLNVGDSLENDVVAATAVGIRSVWLNRNKEEIPPTVGIEHEIHSLSELPGLLGESQQAD